MTPPLPRAALGAAAGAAAVLATGCGGASHSAAESALRHAHRTAPREPVARLVRIGRFHEPVAVTQAPGEPDRILVAERNGRIRVLRDGHKLRRPFLSLRGKVSLKTEQGLLSLAFPPDYQRSRRLYVSFTNRRGTLVVREYRRSRRSPDRLERAFRLVFRLRQPTPTHHSGNLVFGPDGLLYIGTGDGGGPADPRRVAQNRGTLYGKILRIDPHATRRRRYRVPVSNPFVRSKGVRAEIWAYGFRNPWRFTFDRKTGALWAGDVGQETFEEINRVRRGQNLGWSAFEGNRRFNRRVHARNAVPPVHTYRHGRAGCSVTGGYVVRDEDLPALEGRYLYSDFCNGEIRSLAPPHGRRAARDVRSEQLRAGAVSSFGEGLDGTIFVASLTGPVYRLAAR